MNDAYCKKVREIYFYVIVKVNISFPYAIPVIFIRKQLPLILGCAYF